MSNTPDSQSAPNATAALVIPAFSKSPALTLDIGKTKEAETRLVEAKTVNPITYSDLEHCFNESYRELKGHLSKIGYQIALANKALEDAKAEVILVDLPEHMKDKAKSWDSADLRKALMTKNQNYRDAQDRIDMLKAMESFMDGKIKVMEKVSVHMRKQMDLVLRSGLSGADLYNTYGKKK